MKLLYFSIIIVFLLSCKNGIVNNNVETIDCDKLVKGLIDINSDEVNLEINKLVGDLYPAKTDDDKNGHKENIILLIKRLNKSCNNIEAELLCYACIETNPPQSEIGITIVSSGTPIKRIVDISTPDDAVLQCVRVH